MLIVLGVGKIIRQLVVVQLVQDRFQLIQPHEIFNSNSTAESLCDGVYLQLEATSILPNCLTLRDVPGALISQMMIFTAILQTIYIYIEIERQIDIKIERKIDIGSLVPIQEFFR